MEKIKETLEEAAKKYSGIAYDRNDYDEKYYNQQGCDKYDAFIEGAKWQAERMYSEEEVKEMIIDAINSCTNGVSSHCQDFDEWFEQNKKK
jgi:hypothetical protein